MILDLFKLDGKVALVTGAGRDWVRRWRLPWPKPEPMWPGWIVISLDETAARLQALGRRFLPCQR